MPFSVCVQFFMCVHVAQPSCEYIFICLGLVSIKVRDELMVKGHGGAGTSSPESRRTRRSQLRG